jgi:hypothetical protein
MTDQQRQFETAVANKQQYIRMWVSHIRELNTLATWYPDQADRVQDATTDLYLVTIENAAGDLCDRWEKDWREFDQLVLLPVMEEMAENIDLGFVAATVQWREDRRHEEPPIEYLTIVSDEEQARLDFQQALNDL